MFEAFMLIIGCMISIIFIDSILVSEKSEERLENSVQDTYVYDDSLDRV